MKKASVVLCCLFLWLAWGCGTSSGVDFPIDVRHEAGDGLEGAADQGEAAAEEVAPEAAPDEAQGCDPALPGATGSRAFDIQDVASGSISMTEAIKDIILEEYCSPYVS